MPIFNLTAALTVSLTVSLAVSLTACAPIPTRQDFQLRQDFQPRLQPGAAEPVNQTPSNNLDGLQIQHPENNKDITNTWATAATFNEADVTVFDVSKLAPKAAKSSEIVTLIKCGLPSDQQLLAVDTDGKVVVWDLRTDRGYTLIELGYRPSVARLSPTCRYLAASSGNVVGVTDLVQRREIARLSRIRARTTALEWASSVDQIYFGVSDSSVYLWKFLEPEGGPDDPNLERYVGHSSVIKALASFPRGRVFFSADWAGTLSAWLRFDADPQQGEYDVNIFGDGFFSEKVQRVTANRSADGPAIVNLLAMNSFIVGATDAGDLELWQNRGFKKATSVEAHKGSIYGIAGSPSGELIASAGRDEKLKVFRINESMQNEERVVELNEIQSVQLSGVRALTFSDERHVYAGTAAGGIAEILIDG